jgi:putative SOS response-associated peptidase YedK
MCAQFLIKTTLKNIEAFFDLEIQSDVKDIDERVVPYRPGYVIVEREGSLYLQEMQFSLVPSWSKEPKVKFATHNARIETIAEKPTWKGPLQNRRALVPITRFIEPIYTGKYAGNMVQFHEPEDSVLYAAAIWDSWTNKETGEVIESFSIITGEPPKFIADIGHDRCPVFVTKDIADQWLEPVKKPADELIKLLNENSARLHLTVDIDRPLKSGWEKRVRV